jgi:hypothetical protein
VREFIVFRPEQIKSAIGNSGAFDQANPDIRFNLPADATPQQKADAILAKQRGVVAPLEAVTKAATKATGLHLLTGKAYDLMQGIGSFIPEGVKAGVVSDYGIPEAVIDRRDAMFGTQRQKLRDVQYQLDGLMNLTRAESRVAHEWMNRNDEVGDALLDQLPEESRAVLRAIKAQITTMGAEAVRLGQLSAEAYERHENAYLHRSYKKYELEQGEQSKANRARAIRVLGDQYKGRGMLDPVGMSKIEGTNPGWWQRKMKEGTADVSLKGQHFIRFQRHAARGEGVGVLEGMDEPKGRGKLLEVVYWPASEAVPAKYGDWYNEGTWKAIGTKGGDVLMWRDFTAEERRRMGEIDEVRFAVAKTMQQMIHDIEVGKYLEWLANTQAKPKAEGPVVEASENMRDAFKPGTWVKVPTTEIPGTGVRKYGKLAGLYLPGPIWNDVRQTVNWKHQPLGETYAAVLRAWKISKTALTPTTHMNNVMANVMMADWHDIRAAHLAVALDVFVNRKKPENKLVFDRFEDAGGAVGTYALSEIQREQLAPMIQQLQDEVARADEGLAIINASAVLQALLAGRFRDAVAAAGQSKTAKWGSWAGGKMIDLYQAEDVVFRLAAFIKAKGEGLPDLEAGKFARRSFLDYNINAPWIVAARSTAFPFISFVYRAVPMLAETAARKPWKLAKLALVFGALNAIGYALSGGDEDKERKLLPEEKRGRIFGFLVPKLIRMPWNDANDQPVFLDIRRWIPVGDIVDVGQTNSAIPVLPAMMPGGPLAVLFEIMTNTSMFTGRDIVKDTDSAAERAGKVVSHLYRAFAPNLALLPGTPAFNAIYKAGSGQTDDFGREQSVPQAAASAVGVKLSSYAADQLMLNARRDMRSQVGANIMSLRRQAQRGGMTEAELREKVTAQVEKKKKILEEFRKRAQ